MVDVAIPTARAWDDPLERAGMLARGSLVAELFGADQRELAARVGRIVTSWGDGPARWEAEGRLPRSAFEALGREGVFRERWSHGLLRGLPYAIMTSDVLGPASSSLALAVMTHCEVFVGAVGYQPRAGMQADVLEQALSGTAIGCFAATERGAGSDLSSVRTTARPSQRGWRLVGEKHWVGNAGTATHALVVAHALEDECVFGLSLFLVPLDLPGVEVAGFYRKAGLNAIDCADLHLDVELPQDALLGAAGSALVQATRVLLLERVSIAGQMVTAARLAIRLATAFARRREVFGDRLIDKQAVRHALAQHQAELWSVEAFLADVLRKATSGADIGREAAALKLVATGVASRVVDGAMQVMGGRGYMANFPIERCWRDIRAARIGGGSDELMREMVAGAVDRSDTAMEMWLGQLEECDRPTQPGRDALETALPIDELV